MIVIGVVFAGIAYVTLYQSRTIGVMLIVAFILTMTHVTEHLTQPKTPSPPVVNLLHTPGVTSAATNTLAPSTVNQKIPTLPNPTAPAVKPPTITPPVPVASKTVTPIAPVKPMSLSALQSRAKEVEADLVYLQGLGLHPATNDTLRDRLAEKIDLDKQIKALGGSKIVTIAPPKVYPALPPLPSFKIGLAPVLEYFGGF